MEESGKERKREEKGRREIKVKIVKISGQF